MSSRKDDVIEAALPDILTGESGEWLYWPTENRGAWTADDLRTIADELDALNKRYTLRSSE